MILRSPINKKGFATLTMLLFLPLIGLLMFTMAISCYFIQYKTKMRSLCISESILIQKSIVRYEENLFRLNPLARALRFRLKIAYLKLIAAIASENAPLAAEIELEILEIKADQNRLDQSQKALIHIGNLQTQLQSKHLEFRLEQLSHEIESIWSFYLYSLTRVRIDQSPSLAVKPDSAEPAPVYELSSDYSKTQMVAYHWHHRFQTKDDAQTFIQEKADVEMSCSVTAKKEGERWTTLINADKY